MLLRTLDRSSFRKDAGHCWIASLPSEIGLGDAPEQTTSKLLLFEGDSSLGPAHTIHERVRAVGLGAYSHWGTELWFSTSDNSDPSRNGRSYSVVAFSQSEVENEPNRQESISAQPVNWQPRSLGPEDIESDARYALAVAKSYIDGLPGGLASLPGRSFLELGPGPNLGSTLALLCLGAARVSAADRFIPVFDAQYHVPLYGHLLDLLKQQYPGVRLSPLKESIEARTHDVAGLSVFAAPLERLSDYVTVKFDITASNAVLEHLFDPKRAIESLFSLTENGGLGVHQVDFRDHRSFERPLEFLLDDERSFAGTFERSNAETGNRIRPHQLKAMFLSAGFREAAFEPNMLAAEEYLNDFLPRLRASIVSPYQALETDLLRSISGRFFLR